MLTPKEYEIRHRRELTRARVRKLAQTERTIPY